MNEMQASMVGIDSLIHATGHAVPHPIVNTSADVQALRDDVREAIVAIYCDHDDQAARRIGHARWLLREGASEGTVSSMHIEEAAFHLRQHHPWEALSALRQAGDALLMVQLDKGEPS
ncbi:MAG: hypothetical protein KF871_02500 [Hydrogenophaga sp.]|uniref:hypothetical protein n=1 Tax=Hydrogenophaga sp. TaxID=1904254 RepID=UPI001DCEC073|nr:hypothetical protein [Hydrogenophaga sp.]MBX3608741.1 hypothetical protein [Hydrogenophaga sp.]